MASEQSYNIELIIAQMEQDLIKAYKRSMSKGLQSFDIIDGIDINAWQINKLKDLSDFRKETLGIVKNGTRIASNEIKAIIGTSFQEGAGFSESVLKDSGITDKSFGIINRRKMNALIASTQASINKVGKSALRMVDDEYRKIIFKTQFQFNAGATTLPEAIDMAAKDFLSLGINSIQYSDGRRVNIASYSEMSLRASSKSAYLIGQGQQSAELGVTKVKVSSYGGCSDTCLPWQGKVYIDDVYAGGVSDGETTLLSTAMSAGLYHPNCKHSQGPYIEGITYEPVDQDIEKIRENYKVEQRQREIERNITKYKRMEEGSIGDKMQRQSKEKVKKWQKEMRDHLVDNPQLRRSYRREKSYGIPPKLT